MQEVNPEDESWSLITSLMSLTIEGEVQWRMLNQYSYDSPVSLRVGNKRVVFHNDGSFDIVVTDHTIGSIGYKWEPTSIGRDLYRAARSQAWDDEKPGPDDAVSDLIQDIKDRYA